MKDSEFIELLNLYLDHEISSADAARLEAEVARHPGRARIYRQYCGMQKACMILADQFHEAAPARLADRIAVAAPVRGNWGLTFAATSLAAAACFAAVLLVRRPAAETRGPAVVSHSIASTVAAVPSVESKPSFNFQVAGGKAGAPALLASSGQQDPFAWMNQVQLTPIQRVSIEPFLYDPKSPLDIRNGAFNTSQPNLQGQAETTAFRLQLDK
jgi:hypothetical protein